MSHEGLDRRIRKRRARRIYWAHRRPLNSTILWKCSTRAPPNFPTRVAPISAVRLQKESSPPAGHLKNNNNNGKQKSGETLRTNRLERNDAAKSTDSFGGEPHRRPLQSPGESQNQRSSLPPVGAQIQHNQRRGRIDNW